jgi:hypothetical protein
MSIHVVMPPALKGSTGIIGMLAINFDELVKNTTGLVQVLVPKVITENQEYLGRK